MVKIKEPEKRDKYFDLAKELKKLWSMRVTVIPVIARALGTVLKGVGKDWSQRKNRDHPDQVMVAISANN